MFLIYLGVYQLYLMFNLYKVFMFYGEGKEINTQRHTRYASLHLQQIYVNKCIVDDVNPTLKNFENYN